MTVSSGYAPNSSTGNGVTTVFPYNFRIFAAADLEVSVDGVVKTLTTDYTVSGVGAAGGGNVTFVASPANGTTVIRRRNMALVRTTDYQDNGDLLADVLNPDQDAPVMMLQQAQEQVNRSLKAPLGDTTDMTLPSAATRAQKGLVFDATGKPVMSAALGDLSAALVQADAAAATATAQAGVATTQAGTATTQAGVATTQAGTATTQAGVATTQAGIAAGWAATSASSAKFYDTIALGNAGVADGATFGVKAGGSDALLRPTVYRRNSAGNSTLLYAVLPASEFDGLFDQATVSGVAWGVADAAGHAALSVLSDGTVEADTATVNMLNGATKDSFGALSQMDPTTIAPSVAWSVADPGGRAAIAVLTDGSVEVGAIKATSYDSVAAYQVTDPLRYAGSYGAELVYINDYGQSNAMGASNGAVTTAQEYDNIGFPAQANAPVATVTLTAANTQNGTFGESPIYGTLGHIKELILEEAGIAYTQQGYQLLGCNNGWSGFSLNALKKGTTPYSYVLSQVTAGYNIAQAAGKSFAVGATTWTQGEANAGPRTSERDDLILLAANLDTDMRAITGQGGSVPFLTWQVASMASKEVALGQLLAANASPLINMACPAYQFAFAGDGIHLDTTSLKWLGGYFGLAYKRVVIDGKDWSPLQPLSTVMKQGAVALVKFTVPVRPLVIDTDNVPAQTNYGFTLVTSGGSALTINSISVVEPDTIKVVAAAPIPAGALLRYGLITATGKGGSYVGGAGNLRDSQGDRIVYSAIGKPMHNWCVFFEYAL